MGIRGVLRLKIDADIDTDGALVRDKKLIRDTHRRIQPKISFRKNEFTPVKIGHRRSLTQSGDCGYVMTATPPPPQAVVIT